MKDCCGDPDSMRGSLGGIVEVPGGSRDGVVDSRTGEGLLAFDEVRVFVGGNAGAGDEGLQNVTGGSSPCDDNCSNLDIVNDHGLFIKEIKEMQEGYGDFVEVEKESNNLVLNRRTSVENPKAVEGEDLGVAHVGLQTISQTEFSCSQMSYTNDTSVDSKNGVAALIDEMKEIDKGYNKSVLAEKENEHLHVVLEKEPFVKTPDMIEDAGIGAKNSLTVTCSLCDDNGASNVGEWKESKIRSEIYIGTAEKNCHSCLDDKMLIKGTEMADQEHNSKPPGLSTLLTSGDVSESSGTHIALKVGDATQSSSEDKGCEACNRCETVPLISSVSAADCHLISIDGKTVKQVESCSSVPEKSTGSMHSGAALAGGKSEGELLSGVEGIECNICKDKMLYSDYDNSEKDEPVNSQNFQGLTSTSIRVEGDEVCNHLEENSVLSEQAVVPAGCISRGLSGGSLEEVASCFSGEGLSFQQSSSSFTVVLAHPSDPVTATDCERKVTGVVNAVSTCCSNVKDSCGQVSDGGLVNSKPAPLFVFRRTNPKRAASLRNNQVDVKPNHLTGKRNRARKCKKAADASMSISSITLGKNNMRRKRSCFNRMTRKSVWGKIDSLLSVFTENISIVDLAQIQSKYLKRFKCCRSKGKKRMAHGDRNLRFPETQPAFSTHPMQLNGTIYLQPKFPDALNSQCSTESGNDALQNLSSPTVLHIPSRHGGGDCDPSADVVAPGQKFLQRDGQQGEKDIESTLTQDISCENMLEECPGVSSQDGSQPLVIDNRNLLNPESSPDSDIYNPVLDANTTTEPGAFTIQNAGVNNNRIVPERTVLHGIDVEALNTSEAIVNLESASALDVQLQTGNKKDKKEKDVQTSQKEYILSEQDLIDKKLHNLDQTTATEPLKYVRQRRNGIKERHLTSSDSNKKVSRKGSRRAFTGESNILGMTELDCSEEPRKVELGLETWAMPEQEIRNIQPEEGGSVISNKTKGLRLSRSSKTKVGREKSNLTDPSRRQRRKSFGQKNSNIQKTEKQRNKKKNQTLDGCHEALGSMKLSPVRVCNELDKPKDGTYGLDGQSVRQRKAWVLCDDCHQWRCIPTALADMIDQSDCRWTCKENPDKAFADCSLPQEKTNSEINAELEISDASCDEDAPKPNFARPMKSKISASQPAPWTHIKSNLYLHRNRKSQTIDETMVCHCKPSSEASLGCGDQCLNRMLNIECVKGTCPCGELCSNQQFQKRKYSRLKWIPCGKKGFGLQLLEDVSSGQFLIEYVGEVLDFPTYESRQRYYASRGQKHFYFMTLNGGEVIDACAKGNLGRFINHSCDPNCRTEKWMVNGEVCIGLFAIRDIKKGEEVTFNYNYVRVFGAAAKKCVCGSSICQGYIGGDPLNTEVIVQDDSDDEYLERFMVHEDNEKAVDMDVTLSDANNMIVKDADVSMDKKELLKDCSPISETEDDHQFKDTLCASSSDDISFSSMGNLQVRDAISRPLPEIQLLEESSKRLDNRQNKEITSPPSAYAQQLDIPSQASRAATVPISDSAVNISASGPIDEQLTRSKSFFARSSNSSHTIKKSKQSTKPMVPQKAKKLPVQSGNAQFERVEKELNELLDADGGISKRKDATRGYLKLLFVTAAEGDNVGAASQSIRDLSLILDALLKTKSRTVLVDIINKNGLQMLHNIMKQNRSKFTRIPILRKLLKVLEFLALKGILTPDHINKGPPCSGMESFKESMLSLTRHNDNQVHQIARNFRDKWIPRGIKRVEPTDRDKMQLDTQRSYNSWFKSSLFNRRIDQGARDSDAIVCVSEPMEQLTSSSLVMPGEASAHSSQQVCSLPLTDNNPTTGTRTRKRKSRWDQPSDYKIPDQQNLWSSQQEVASEAGSNIVKTGFSDLEYCSSTKVLKKSLDCSIEEDCPMDGVAGLKKFLQQNTDDEVPPGFGLQQKDHLVTPETLISRSEVVVGYLQERYLSHLSVSYGIPVSLVQKLGTPDCNTEAHQCWTVAPSMPFHPFPPLPPYPRGQSKLSNLGTESSRKSVITQGSSEIQPCNLDSRATDAAPVPSTSVERPVDSSEAWPRNPHNTQRMSWSSNSGGRRFFQPERGGNSQRFRRRWAPWPQEGSDGHRGSVRYRDSGRSSRGERKYWPPWPQEDSC